MFLFAWGNSPLSKVNSLNSSLNLFLKMKICVKLVALHWETVCHLHGEAI